MENRPPFLILFDLDGTLIDVFDHHIASVNWAIREVWNVGNNLPKHKRYGIPQKETIRRICASAQVPEEEISLHIGRAMQIATAEMQRRLPDDLTSTLLPGAVSLLTALEKIAYVRLALATGTLGPTAEILLERSGLKRYFPVSAFGHECSSRQELVQIALERSLDYFELDAGSLQVATVGDAPSDIQAGKAIGAKTISVATSSFTMDELAEYAPDVLLNSFANVQAAMQGILGG